MYRCAEQETKKGIEGCKDEEGGVAMRDKGGRAENRRQRGVERVEKGSDMRAG
jgi:hypothetical protein